LIYIVLESTSESDIFFLLSKTCPSLPSPAPGSGIHFIYGYRAFCTMVVGLVTLGWILIIIGALMLLFEVAEPGYFIGVPATVLIILGIMLLFGVDILNSVWGVVIGVAAALAAAGFTVWMYSRLTPNAMPTTISRDSLVGRMGLVTRTVETDSIAGKVSVEGVQWSARTESGEIPEGKKVIVVRSEGVHVVVKEVE